MGKDNSDIQKSSKHHKKKKHDKSRKKSKKHKKVYIKNDSSKESEKISIVKKKRKKKDKKCTIRQTSDNEASSTLEENVADVPLELMSKSKAMAPMTKEEWSKRQSVIRRVYDEESGRHRLIKGDGEVIEEIVSFKRHKEINKTATMGDGAYFQNKINLKINIK